mgnify:CR=1 FL=1
MLRIVCCIWHFHLLCDVIENGRNGACGESYIGKLVPEHTGELKDIGSNLNDHEENRAKSSDGQGVGQNAGMIRIALGTKQGLNPGQHTVGSDLTQKYISNAAADQGAADEGGYIEQPTQTFLAPEKGHNRIGHDRANDTGADDLAQNGKNNSAFACPIENAGQESAENGTGQGDGRDPHGDHADDADKGGAEQRIPGTQEHRADNVDKVSHGAHTLHTEDGGNNHAQGDKHGKGDHFQQAFGITHDCYLDSK